jgi:L-2,4-diaminobutyrate decarboxylase
MLDRGINLHDPRYIGHQVPAPPPVAGLFDAVGAVTNQVMAIYEMGPWATAVEEAMVNRLGEEIGWRTGTFSGLSTHGGSLANLTALLTARNVSLKDSWELGVSPHDPANPPVVVVHADAHYSVSRAVAVLGLGTRGVVKTRLDDRRRMDPAVLDDTLTMLRGRNQPVVAVVACACATPIGAFDPLTEIAEVCRRHSVWLHVDAAHGGSVIFSDRHKHLVSGLKHADSVAWDAHKMMFAPALCAFVLYRDRSHRFEAFRQEAPYIFDPSVAGLLEYDVGLKTIECTKRATAFGVWGLWALFGRRLFSDLVDVTFDLGQIFYHKLEAASDFEALHEPECNILAFRHLPKGLVGMPGEVIGEFQLNLRRRLIESGEFYIVSTKIDGIGALRVAIMNPLTTAVHFDQLLDALRVHGEKIDLQSQE